MKCFAYNAFDSATYYGSSLTHKAIVSLSHILFSMKYTNSNSKLDRQMTLENDYMANFRKLGRMKSIK